MSGGSSRKRSLEKSNGNTPIKMIQESKFCNQNYHLTHYGSYSSGKGCVQSLDWTGGLSKIKSLSIH